MSTTVVRRLAVLCVLLSPGLVACGSDGAGSDSADGAASSPARSVVIQATEYAFAGDPGDVVAGDTIEFALENVGDLDHSLEVLSASGSSLGKTERVPPGASANVTVTFEESGVYRLICDVDDHFSRGQGATLTVQ